VFIEGRRAAKQLIASIDPLYAAQVRYDNELAKAQTLQRQGMLTAAEFAKVQMGLKGAARRPGHALRRSRQGRRQRAHRPDGNDARRARLGRPVRRRRVDVTQIFAMHMGMLAQAASMSGDSLGVRQDHGRPVGAGDRAGIAILGTLISKHHDAAETVDGLVEKMRKQAGEARMQERRRTRSGRRASTACARPRRSCARSSRTRSRSRWSTPAASLTAREASWTDAEASSSPRTMLSSRAQTKAALESVAAQLQNPEIDAGAAADIQGRLTKIDGRIGFLKKEVGDLTRDISNSEKTISDAQLKITERTAGYATDKAKAVADTFAAIRGNIEATRKLATTDTLGAVNVAEKAAGDAIAQGLESEVKTFDRKIVALKDSLLAGKTGRQGG
jgi:hypothetical protein